MPTMPITKSQARTLYTWGNNAGHGYEAAAETIEAAIAAMVAEGGTLVLDRAGSDDVAVVEDSAGELVAIGGDASGRSAWAVTIRTPITDEDISALRDEAGSAGDTEIVAICDRALAGDASERAECERVIRDTEMSEALS